MIVLNVQIAKDLFTKKINVENFVNNVIWNVKYVKKIVKKQKDC